MFQFTTETIINSAKLDNGKDRFVYDANNKVLRVMTTGNYPVRTDGTGASKITKTAYEAPVIEKIEFDAPDFATLPVDANSDVFRLSVVLMKVDENPSDYVDATTLAQKQLWYEGVGCDGTEVLTSIKAGYDKEVQATANPYILISEDSGKWTISCVDPSQKFVKVELQQVFTPLNATTGYTSLTGYDTFKVVADLLNTATKTEGNVGFGTTRQLMKNHRLPTIENTYWFATHKDERPVPGGKYNQYQLTLTTVRPNMGMSAVGQEVKSVTNHIFYILQGEAANAFEAQAKLAGLMA
jgi:hypothetical protein